MPSGLVRTEWRLRELERLNAAQSGDAGKDLRRLIGEVRRSHHTLLQILAASVDLDESDPTLSRIKFLANDELSMYPMKPE